MSKSRKILFSFRSDDSNADGLDPWELNEKCVKGEVTGLEAKTVVDMNDGEAVTIELTFDTRDAMSNWFDANVSESYYKIAMQL